MARKRRSQASKDRTLLRHRFSRPRVRRRMSPPERKTKTTPLALCQRVRVSEEGLRARRSRSLPKTQAKERKI
ncbi:hypothetical protein [Thermus brockianus]|uniref:hypothetical protein n=1 Tax=Thermus brockianus TaxID=56956 RepID=UPI001FCB3BDC|nr:hypothetical protein [Thermus brockianus]